MKKLLKILGVIFVICIIFALIFLNSDDTNKTPTTNQNVENSENAESNKENSDLLYSDDNYKITYKEIKETPGITMGMLQLKFENHSDKNAFVTLTEGYVNDTAITFLGGNVTLDGVQPGKNSICTFSFGYDGILESVDEIEKLEFKIQVLDPDNISTNILTTDTITVYPN